MKGTTALDGSRNGSGRRTTPRSAQAALSAFAVLCGIFSATAGVARATEDEPRVSITPRVPPHPGELAGKPGSIRVDVNLVLIPVTVTDRYERPVRGLQKSDFHLFEDGVERQISQFFSEESPISIGIVFDASASMRAKLEQSFEAVREFLKMCLPGDEFFLTKFNDRPETVFGFTTDAKDIEEGLASIHAQGWTSLFDAIYLGVHQMKHATHARKVLMVLSDGGDNNSRYTEREIKSMVKEEDVRIFSISILDRSPSLETIAAESGGRAFRVHKIDELPDLAARISAELHSEYVLGFAPADQTNGAPYRKVNVQLMEQLGTAGLRASWKHGYFGPGQ
jgi:Ca-activated chloride channel family protein